MEVRARIGKKTIYKRVFWSKSLDSWKISHLQNLCKDSLDFGPELFIAEGFSADDVDDEQDAPVRGPPGQRQQRPKPELDDGCRLLETVSKKEKSSFNNTKQSSYSTKFMSELTIRLHHMVGFSQMAALIPNEIDWLFYFWHLVVKTKQAICGTMSDGSPKGEPLGWVSQVQTRFIRTKQQTIQKYQHNGPITWSPSLYQTKN